MTEYKAVYTVYILSSVITACVSVWYESGRRAIIYERPEYKNIMIVVGLKSIQDQKVLEPFPDILSLVFIVM